MSMVCKMKRKTFFLFCMGLINFIFAKDFDDVYCGELFCSKGAIPTYLYLKKNIYTFEVANGKSCDLFEIPKELIENDGYYVETGTFKILEENGIEYLEFETANQYKMMDKIGCLHYGQLIYLCRQNEIIYDSLFFDKEDSGYPFLYKNEYSVNSSSYLTEELTKYDGKNFYVDNSLLLPWVENKADSGIGEWIEFAIKDGADVDAFLISNGYVNFDKPNLYQANNRVKKFRIQSQDNDIDFTVLLKDTSQFQEVKLPKTLSSGKKTIRFTIEEIYRGNKWNDTCVNRIIPIKSKNIK